MFVVVFIMSPDFEIGRNVRLIFRSTLLQS